MDSVTSFVALHKGESVYVPVEFQGFKALDLSGLKMLKTAFAL